MYSLSPIEYDARVYLVWTLLGIIFFLRSLHYKLAKFKTSNCSGQRNLPPATARPKNSAAGQGRRGGCHHSDGNAWLPPLRLAT